MNTFKRSAVAAGILGVLSFAGTSAFAAALPSTNPVAVAGDVHQVRGGHGGHGGGHHGGGGHHHHHGGHWRGGYGIGFIGVPAYGYYNGYSSGCGWLHRRAVNTGSRYWWRRYRECRGW